MRTPTTFNRVTAAFDGSAGGHAALVAAAAIARATGQALRVVSVFAPTAPSPPWLDPFPGFLCIAPDAEREARAALERAVEGLPEADAAFLVGAPGAELARESELTDLMVLGSRGYGPGGTVVLEGLGDEVMRTAACPAPIRPRGVQAPLAGLFGKLLTHSTA
jgi:nucleotide-binding universal stress UspA family protein